MNILIADSGSTKTEWAFSDGQNDIELHRGAGMNPYFSSSEVLENEITLQVRNNNFIPDKIFFYGAGCSSETQISLVRNAFNKVFPNAKVSVDHDLLAAARALCGRSEGIACILGTGSNSCHFDGNQIISQRPALGYVLGDEGAGSQIGKALIKAHLYGELPESISDAIIERFGITKDNVLDEVYKKTFPNRYLASFSIFVGENLDKPEMSDLVKTELGSFADRHLMKYDAKALPVHFTGSVASHFRDILSEVLNERGMHLGKILSSPLQGLINYHLQQA